MQVTIDDGTGKIIATNENVCVIKAEANLDISILAKCNGGTVLNQYLGGLLASILIMAYQ